MWQTHQSLSLSFIIYGPNISKRNIVDENDNVITLEKILIKARIKHVNVFINHILNRLHKDRARDFINIFRFLVQLKYIVVKESYGSRSFLIFFGSSR